MSIWSFFYSFSNSAPQRHCLVSFNELMVWKWLGMREDKNDESTEESASDYKAVISLRWRHCFFMALIGS